MNTLLKLAMISGGALAAAYAAKHAVTVVVRDKAMANALKWPLFFAALFTALVTLNELAEKYCKWHFFAQYCAGVVTAPVQAPAPAPPKPAAPTTAPIAQAPPPVIAPTTQQAQRDPALSVNPGSGQSFRDRLADGSACPTCPEMIMVPQGSFNMGSPADEPERRSDEGPVRAVTIRQPFAVGKYAVTFDEWDRCVEAGGCSHKPGDANWGRRNRPVINVSWNDAKEYVAWLSRTTGQTYRLPSEAEREYFTRAGTRTPFWWGTSITPEQANYDGLAAPYAGGGAKGEYRRLTLPVQSFRPNPWGLYQVHGNVLEWVEDCAAGSYQGAPSDGSKAPETANCSRVVRGGTWSDSPRYLRSANRGRHDSDLRYFYFGFRVARSVG